MSLLNNHTSPELIDKISTMVLVLDDQGRIEMINTAGSELLGYSRNELLGKEWVTSFILPGERHDVAGLFTRIVAGQEKVQPYNRNSIVIRGGDERIFSWHNTALTNNKGRVEGILSTGEDITRQVRAEEELRRSEGRYRRFMEHIPDGLFIFERSGKIVDVNRHACKRLGYSRQELLGRNIVEIDSVLQENNLQFCDQARGVSSGPIIYEALHQPRHGEPFPAEVIFDLLRGNGTTPQYIVVARDSSARRDQQQQLKENRDLLRVIIDAIPEIICVKDGQGRWLLANRFALHLYGLDDFDYQGKTDTEIGEFAVAFQQCFQRCMETDVLVWQNKEPLSWEGTIRNREGEDRLFDMFKAPLYNKDGRRKALVVIGRDITDQKAIEQRYRKLFEQSPLAYISSSLSGEIIAVNQTVLSTFGYSPEQLIGKKLTDFFTPASRKLFLDHYGRFIKGEYFSGTDYQVIKADGKVATITVTAALIKNDNGEPVNVQTIAVDVTAQRQVETRIQESEEKYRLLFERAPLGFVHYDTNFKVTACNTYYCRMMEVNKEKLIGFDLNTLRDKKVVPVLKKALLGETGNWMGEYESTITRKKLFISLRTAPLYKGQGKVKGGLAIIVDRSSQKKAEADKKLLLSAIDQTTETVVITDTKGVIEYVNPAFEQVTGFTASEALGKTPGILKSYRHDSDFYRKMWQGLVEGQVWKGKITNKRKNGEYLEEDMTISPVRDRDGVITNYVAVKRDITREITLEKQLHQSQKMEAIGTLAGGIAHDFNNILSAILGYAQLVDMKMAKNGLERRDIRQIITAGNRAADLVKQILTFSRKAEEEFRVVQLQGIIRDALKLLRSSLPTTIQLRQVIPQDCGAVRADPVQIHQVLMNLCANAKQAMDGRQGELVVRLAEVKSGAGALSEQPIQLAPGRWLELQVSDTGEGISPDILQKIFDPFFSTRKNKGGTGLGLSVVHGIVKNHGGEITAVSSEGKGTTFYVYLPMVSGEDVQDDPECIIHKPATGNESILVVDDEPLLVDVMKRMLTGCGYTVHGFTDSSKALQWFKQPGNRVDLVVTDMTMPQLTGEELAKDMLAVRPEIPVILCTGYSEIIDAEQAKKSGISRFITKPVENWVLAGTIREVLDGKGE